MQVTCSECDKKQKVNDNLAGKKIKCSECGASINVPRKVTAISKGPAAKGPAAPGKKTRKPIDDEDDDAGEESKKKGGMGLILGLVGCAVLLLCLVFPAGGVGVWYFGFRKPTEDQQAKKEDGDPKKTDQVPGDKDIKVKLADGRAVRNGNLLEVSVELDVADPKASDVLAILVLFPSDPNVQQTVLLARHPLIKSGKYEGKFFHQQSVIDDATCDIVARLVDGKGDLKKGKEIARLAGVAIPPQSSGAPSVKLANVIARQNPNDSRLIEFSFDCTYDGPKPKSNTVWFDVEFIDPVFGERKSAPLTLRVGNNIKQQESIVASAANPLKVSELCDIFVSDRQGGRGNLAKAQNVKIQTGATADFSLVLSGGKVEADGGPIKLHKVSVDLKLNGKPKLASYHCAVIFSVKGEKQKPINFGGAALGRLLENGMKLSGYVDFPAGGDPTCEIVVHEVFNEKIGPLAVLKDVAITKSGAGGASLVMLTNAKVERSKVFPDLCSVNVEAKSSGPVKGELVRGAVVFSVGGVKQKPVTFGLAFFADDLVKGVKLEDRSVKMPANADATCEIILQDGVSAKPLMSAELKNVAVEGTAVVSDSNLVTFSNIRVHRVNENTVQVQFDYEFNRPPDPKKWYTFMVQKSEGGKIKKGETGRFCYQSIGDKVVMKGQVNQRVPGTPGFGDGKIYRVWGASGINPLDAVDRVTKTNIVKLTPGDPPAAGATLSNVSVQKLRDEAIKIKFQYELGNDPEPKKKYALLLQRGDDPETKEPTIALEASGDKWKKSGQLETSVVAIDIGKAGTYRLWLAEMPAKTPLSSKVVIKRDDGKGKENPAEPIEITKATFTALGKAGTRLEVAYKFVGDAKPNPNTNYFGFFQGKGGQPNQFFATAGGKLQAEGVIFFNLKASLARTAEFEVWIVEAGSPPRVISNRKKAEIR